MQGIALFSISWATSKGVVTLDFSNRRVVVDVAGRKALLISEFPGISSKQLCQMAEKLRQVPISQRGSFFPRVVQAASDVFVHLYVRGLGGGGGPSKPTSAPEVHFFENLPASVVIEEEEHEVRSVRSLVRQILQHPEDEELLRLAFKIVEAFSQKKVITRSMIDEIAPLARIPNKNLLRFLLEAFARHIRDSALTHIQIFHPVKQIIQTADPVYLEQDDLVRIMDVLFDRISVLHSQPQTALKRYKGLKALSGILDAMADTGVVASTDRNLFLIDRKNFRNPIFDVLQDLKKDEFLPLAAEAAYAAQALARIPKNESRPFTILRSLVQAGEMVGLIFEACKKISPSSLMQAYAPFKEVFRIFPAVQRWHDELRTLQLFIQRNCFREFELFVSKLYEEDPVPAFEIGVLNLLVDVVYGHSSQAIRTQALGFLQHRCSCLRKKEIQKAFVQRLLELARHSDELVRITARGHLTDLRGDIPHIAGLIPREWGNYPIDPIEEPVMLSTDLFEEARAQKTFIRPHQDDYEVERKENDYERLTNLPAPMPRFVGRKKHLEELQKHAEGCKADGPRALILIKGPGGVGKSELVIHFVNLSRKLFSLVWHFKAQHRSILYGEYQALAKELGVTSAENIVESVHLKLENLDRCKPWLLVFDNLEASIPIPSRGGMMIGTSQLVVWADDAVVIPMSPLNEVEALEYFSEELLEDDPSCRSLVAQLEGYPLLLRQAVYDIQTMHLTVEAYIKRLEQDHPIWQAPPGMRYPRALARTFEITLSLLQKADPLAYRFLQMSVFLNIDKIQDQLIELWLENEHQEPHLKARIVRSLEQCSVVRMYESGFSIHRLLQRVIRSQLNDRMQTFFVSAVRLIFAFLNRSHNVYAAVPHVLEMTKMFNDRPEWKKRTGLFLGLHETVPRERVFATDHYSQLIATLHACKLYSEAAEHFEAIIEIECPLGISKDVFVVGSEYLPFPKKLFFESLYHSMQYEKFIFYYGKIEGKTDRLDHIDVLYTRVLSKFGDQMMYRGSNLSSSGQHLEAVACFEKGYRYGGSQNQRFLVAYGNCLFELKRYEEAFTTYEKALDVFSRNFPSSSPSDLPEWQIANGGKAELLIIRISMLRVFPFVEKSKIREAATALARECNRFFGRTSIESRTVLEFL